MTEPMMELTHLQVFFCCMAMSSAVWLVFHVVQRLRRRSDAWQKAALIMHRHPNLLVRESAEAVGGLAICLRDAQALLAESEARGWLVRYTGARSDEVRAVQTGGWWSLESKDADQAT